MAKVRVHSFAMSLDGYVAGPHQSIADPLGVGGMRLHEWVFATPAWQQMHGVEGSEEGSETSIDNEWVARADVGLGATIMGRNMFGPIRGPWPNDEWKGWWGDDPPFHHPVFVLTNHPREPISMQGGTTFYFATDGIESTLERAFEAADGKDVRIGGGAATVRQYLQAGLIDELHVAIVPVLLGAGERLFGDLGGDFPAQYEYVEFACSESVAHVRIARRGTTESL
jgi:dihydrofolate reductase